ncbi:MAG: hypothetical protein IJ154_05650 [Bacteroidales bacterium]|nr:hypothetical protein [Bacteroidales bacterium]
MKNVLRTIMLPALLIVAACSNDTDEMMSARQSDEPTEKEMLQTQVKEIAEQYGVLIGFNEERWQKKLPSIVDLRQAIVDHVEMVSSRDSIPMAKRRITSLDYYSPLRVKKRIEATPPVSGSFNCSGQKVFSVRFLIPGHPYPGSINYDIDITVYWTDGGSMLPNSVTLTAEFLATNTYLEDYSSYCLYLSDEPCSNKTFYGLHHAFLAEYDFSPHNTMYIQYQGSGGIGIISFSCFNDYQIESN